MIKKISSYYPLPVYPEQYSVQFMEENGVMLLESSDTEVIVGFVKYEELLESSLLKYHTPLNIRSVTINKQDLSIHLARLVSSKPDESDNKTLKTSLNLDKLAGDAPVINLVNSIIMEGIQQRASDIHIEMFDDEAIVRYRIDGLLQISRKIPTSIFPLLSSRIKIMARLNIMEKRLPQDGRLTVQIGDERADMRVSIIPISHGGESIVLRILKRPEKPLSFLELGFHKDEIQMMRSMTHFPNGLILVTGPTGCGKSTTLNTLLEDVKSMEKKIISIEDPVEYVVEGVDQIQTNDEIGLGFSSILKRVLRQDPDIILVGEIRDSETADLALRAALTGHLVLSTLHTNDAVSVIPRLINMGIEPYLLSSVLRGTTAQRLVRCLCPKCKEEYDISSVERTIFISNRLEAPLTLTKSKGCEYCNFTGYYSRTIINEIINIDNNLEEMINRNDRRDCYNEYLYKSDFRTMLQCGLEKVISGITTIEEIKLAVRII